MELAGLEPEHSGGNFLVAVQVALVCPVPEPVQVHVAVDPTAGKVGNVPAPFEQPVNVPQDVSVEAKLLLSAVPQTPLTMQEKVSTTGAE